MRILCLGLDGADYDLVRDLLAQGKLPTLSRLAREGTFGPLRSTIPPLTPVAWSSFLTGLNPGGHGIFAFTANPMRRGRGLESAATRAGTPLWRLAGAAGLRSAFITVPFTYPPDRINGLLVTGFGGPQRPEVAPASARGLIFQAHPDLITAQLPTRWARDVGSFTHKLIGHVEQIADVCMLALELEPELALLCVDFMSSDIAGHVAWHRLDATHPAHKPGDAGEELVEVYEAVDRACGHLLEQAEWLWDEEPTVFVLSDHGMKPTHWLFRANRWLEEAGYLRYRARTPEDAQPDDIDERGLIRRLRRKQTGEDAPFAEIDFERTNAYAYGYGGLIYLAEAAGKRADSGLARELADAFAAIRHPETGEPAFAVKWKEELFRGPFLEKAPELVILPRDERIYVDSSRQRWPQAFQQNERLYLRNTANFSGQHAVTGILAAAGPGIRVGAVVDAPEILQLPATLLALLGITGDLEGAPIEAILDPGAVPERRSVVAAPSARHDEPVYSEDEEARIVERLRDLGYE